MGFSVTGIGTRPVHLLVKYFGALGSRVPPEVKLYPSQISQFC